MPTGELSDAACCSHARRARLDRGPVWLLAAYALSAGGFGIADALLLLLLFGITLPWSVIGFWNATIGFFIMRFARDPVAAVTAGSVARLRGDEPITASTAILMLRAQRAAGPRHPQPRRR